MKNAYLAGGCFWGVEHYFALLKGVIAVESGYAQSNIESTTYDDLVFHRTTAVECVKISYDEQEISYAKLLQHFFKIIDPTSLNKQGPDSGIQYRTGIYYETEIDYEIAKELLSDLKKEYVKPIVVELEALKNYTKAEEYHQDYLNKHPECTCHIDFTTIDDEDLK